MSNDFEYEIVDVSTSQAELLSCSICTLICRKATVTPCGHLFCHACLMKWRETSSGCPLCRNEIKTSSDCHFDVRAERDINNLSVKCSKENCSWTSKTLGHEKKNWLGHIEKDHPTPKKSLKRKSATEPEEEKQKASSSDSDSDSDSAADSDSISRSASDSDEKMEANDQFMMQERRNVFHKVIIKRLAVTLLGPNIKFKASALDLISKYLEGKLFEYATKLNEVKDIAGRRAVLKSDAALISRYLFNLYPLSRHFRDQKPKIPKFAIKRVCARVGMQRLQRGVVQNLQEVVVRLACFIFENPPAEGTVFKLTDAQARISTIEMAEYHVFCN